jgi:signal transduction histidine kinase
MSFFSCFSKKKESAGFLQTLPVAVWQRDAAGKIIYSNEAYRMMAGSNEAELTPTLYTGKARSETVHLVINGERRLIECHETGSGGAAFDVTAREELENQRKDLNQALTEVMENATSAMAFFDGTRKIARYNQAYLRLWGLEEAFLAQHPRYEEILEQLRERRKLPEQENFSQFRKTQVAYFTNLTEPLQEFFYLPDGTSLRVVVIPYATNGLIFIYDNMTDRLALEQSFNQTVAVKKAAFDHLYEGIAVFGEDARLGLSNPRYADIWQLDWELMEQRPKFSEVLEATEYLFDTRVDWPVRMKGMLSALYERRRETRTLELIDGRVIQWATIPLPDGATLMTYLDISDSVRVERSLRERNQALEEAGSIKTKFLANVSYDLRSPLTSIKGFAEFLLEGGVGALNEKQSEYLRDIHRSALDLSAMIDDVLDVASLEAGYATLDVSEFDIYMMLSSMFPFIQEKMQRLNIKLDFQCPPTIGRMIGDERRLRHAILQVLDQFITFCPKGSNILFKVWEEDYTIRLLIQDDNAKQNLIHTPGEDHHTMVATDTLDAIGSPVIRSLLAMHGGAVETRYVDGQHYSVSLSVARRHDGLANVPKNVQISSSL